MSKTQHVLFLVALALSVAILPSTLALNVTVSLDAPTQLLPGEGSTATVQVTIDDIPVFSFPLNATVTYPDGTSTPFVMRSDDQGTYSGTLYFVTEGNYHLVTDVTLNGETFSDEAYVTVQKPALESTIDLRIENDTLIGTVSQSAPTTISFSVAPLAPGDVSTMTYDPVCTVPCDTTCTISCPITARSGIIKASAQSVYEYTSYFAVGEGIPATTVTYDDKTGTNEPEIVTLTTPAEVFTLFGTQLARVPIIAGTYQFTPTTTGTGTIIVKDADSVATYPYEVIERTNVMTWYPLTANDAVQSWWMAPVSVTTDSLIALPEEPGARDAALLSNGVRTPLSWVKSYVSLPAGSGLLEVARNVPATAPPTTTMPFGVQVGGPGLVRHEFLGTIQAFDSNLNPLSIFTTENTSVFYTQDQFAFVVSDAQGTLTITQPLRTTSTATILFDTLDPKTVGTQPPTDTEFTVYALDGTVVYKQLFTGNSGSRDLMLPLVPGAYLATARGQTTGAAALRVLSDKAELIFDFNHTYSTTENSQITIVRGITNSDLSPRTVDIQIDSTFTTVVNATDSNSNGMVDITIPPGETTLVSTTVFIPQGAVSAPVTFSATSNELNATSQDHILVLSAAVPVYLDADVVSIGGTSDSPLVSIQNNFDQQLAATLFVSGINGSTQLSVLLEPGLVNISLPGLGDRITVRLQVASDSVPQNNMRSRDFRQPAGIHQVHINERLHADHAEYTVQLPTIPDYVLSWIDDQGNLAKATASIDGSVTLWSLGAVPANHEFYAVLTPGAPAQYNPAILLDNNNPQVTKTGLWVPAISTPGYIGFDYLTDLNTNKGGSVTYAPQVPLDQYTIRIRTLGDSSLADNMPVTVRSLTGTDVLTVNQRMAGWQYLGLYTLDQTSSVMIENRMTTAFVVADAIEFTRVSQIGGLVITGNTTLQLSAKVGETKTIDFAAYLMGAVSAVVPPGVRTQYNDTGASLSAQSAGNYTITYSDGSRTLTVLLATHDPIYNTVLEAPVQTPYGTALAQITVDDDLALLAQSARDDPEKLTELGEASGWIFDIFVPLNGKEVVLEQVYAPDFNIPVTITARTEDRYKDGFLLDTYEIALNGAQLKNLYWYDTADAPLLLQCTLLPSQRCNWQKKQDLITGLPFEGKISGTSQKTILAEGTRIEQQKPASRKTAKFGSNWEKREANGRGSLTITRGPSYFDRGSRSGEINTTARVGRGVADVEQATQVEILDNTFDTVAQLVSGRNALTLQDGLRSASISTDRSAVRARVQSNEIWYKNYAPATDLLFTVLPDAVKGEYILYNTSAQRTFIETFTVPNAVVNETPDEYNFVDKVTGQLLWRMWKPYAIDELGKIDVVGHRTKLQNNLVQNGNDFTLTMTVPDDWFFDADRVFPVVVDPTIIGNLSGGDGGYVREHDAGFPDDDAFVGDTDTNGGATEYANGFIRFFTGALPTSAVIQSANFSAYSQTDQGWDAGSDYTEWSFVNTSDAQKFWNDDFRQWAEYVQSRISTYNFSSDTTGAANTRSHITVNSTGLSGLQKILVNDQQQYVTVRAAMRDAEWGSGEYDTNTEYFSWYTGYLATSAQQPQLNVSYTYETGVPQLYSPAFNQTAYNKTDIVYFSVNITDDLSGIADANVTLRSNNTTLSTNYSMTPVQTTGTTTTTVSTTAKNGTGLNRSQTLFADEASYSASNVQDKTNNEPSPWLWEETGASGNSWGISGGMLGAANTGGTDYLTVLPLLNLSGVESAVFRYYWVTDADAEAGECLSQDFYNGSSWYTHWSDCTGNLNSGTTILNLSKGNFTSTFEFRFGINTNNNNERFNIDGVLLTAYRTDRDYNESYQQFDSVSTARLRNLTQVNVTVQVNEYSPNASHYHGNNKPDLELEVLTQNGWVSQGLLNLSSTYSLNQTYTNDVNFTLSITNTTILSDWENSSYNRGVRIRPVYLDYNISGRYDQINYSTIILSTAQTGSDYYYANWTGTLDPLGLYNATQIAAVDTAGNTNTTNYATLSFTLYSLANVDCVATPGAVTAYGENVTFTCDVTDGTNGTGIQNYYVNLTSNVTGFLGWFRTNASGQVETSVNITQKMNLSGTIGNNLTLYYYANKTISSRVAAVDTDAPSWSLWSIGNTHSNNLSDGFSVNRTNTTITARAYWTDDVGLAEAFIEHNSSGTVTNYSITTFTSAATATWINKTFDFSDADQWPITGLINVTTMYAQDFAPNVNFTTPPHYFFLYGTVNVTSISISPSSPAIFEDTVGTCTVKDLYDIAAYNYPVTFYRDSTLIGTNTTDSSGNAQFYFTTNSVGSYVFTCNITDYPTDYYYTTTPLSQTVSVSVVPDSTAPSVRGIATNPTIFTLGETGNISATIYDAAGLTSAYANTTSPTLNRTNLTLNGSGLTWYSEFVPTSEGYHFIRITATDPSANTNVSGYSHFLAAGKAALSVVANRTTVNSNQLLTINVSNWRSTADLETGTQAASATITTTQITNISSYFNGTGSCSSVLRTDAPASNSCRRGGQVDQKLGKLWGNYRHTVGYNGTATTSNEMVPAWQFNLSGIPDDAALTSGSMLFTVINDNGLDNGDTFTVRGIADSNDNTIWDSNGPELTQLQTLTTEFTLATTGNEMQNPGTYQYALSQASLDYIEGHLDTNGLTIVMRPQTGIAANEYVWMETGFGSSSVNSDPELRLNYTAPAVDENSTKVNYTDVLTANDQTLSAVRINVTVSGTDFRGSNYTVFSLNTGNMPALYINVYNGSTYKEKYACEILSRGITVNTTAGTCSVLIRDSDVVEAWKTATNRDVQLQAVYLDNRNEGTDAINWTGLTVEIFNGSALVNSFPGTLNGTVQMTVLRLEGSNYVYNATVYNSSNNLTIGQALNLSPLWSTGGWNVTNRAEGNYRGLIEYLNSSNRVTPQGDGTFLNASFDFVINDTVAPSVNNSAPANNSTIWGQNSSGNNFTFNASDATGFTNCSVYIGGTLRNTTTSITNITSGVFVYSLSEGTYQWFTSCFDNATARNNANSTAYTVYVDNTAPNTNFISPQNNTQTQNTTVNVTVNITDMRATSITWRSFVDGTLNQSGSSQNATLTLLNITALAEGNHSFTVEGTDQVGVTANTTIYIIADRTAPTAYINTSSNSFYNNTTPPINFTLYDNFTYNISFQFYINSVANVSGVTINGTMNTTTALSQVQDGNHSVLVQATDLAGNAANSSTIRVIVDRTAPAVTLNSPAELYNTTASWILFNWSYTDAFSATANCSIYINDTRNASQTSSNATADTRNITGFTQGPWNWTVACQDVAGNIGVATEVRNFTVDTTAPAVNLVSPANNTIYTTIRNATLTYNVSDVLLGINNCNLFVNGAYNQTTYSPAENVNLNFNVSNLTNGVYNWSMSCNDTADNTGTNGTWYFTVNITTLPFSPAANSRVDRDGSDATDPDVLTLVANLTDGESNVMLSFYANLTSPSVGGQTNLYLGNNTTNTSGQATIYWDPSASFYAGSYTWWAENTTRARSNGSLSAQMYGTVAAVYAYISALPSDNYTVTQTVGVSYNLTSSGPETGSVLNSTYGANVSVNFTQPNSTIAATRIATYNTTQWNTSYTLAGNSEVGTWTLVATSNATWFYNTTVSSRTFLVKGLANAVSPANGTTVDRDGIDATGPDLLTLVIEIPGATQAYDVNFTANLTDPSGIAGQTNILLGNNSTNSSGYTTLYYNPNSSTYAGNYTWWGVSNISEINQTRTFISKGGLNSTYFSATLNPNTTYFSNDTVTTELNISSLGIETATQLNNSYALTTTTNVTNTSGSVVSAYLLFNGSNWRNTTLSLQTLYGVGIWNTGADAQGTYFYRNSTNRTLTVYGYLNVTSNSTSPASIFTYQTTTTTCGVNDHSSTYPVSGATVNFYRNGTFMGSNTTNAAGSAELNYNVNVSGTYIITCNVTDQLGIYYYRGPQPERNTTLTVLPFPITPVASANGTVVDRDSYDPTDNDTILLNVTVPTYIPDGVQIDFIANLTTPNIGGQTGITLGSNTTTNGYAILHYNPSSTTYAGNYTWWGNNTSATQNGTMNFIEKGSLATTYADSSLHPNSTYYSNSTITTNTNITSAGPETTDQLNSSYTITANNTFNNTTGTTSSVSLIYNGSQWRNDTFTATTLLGVGVWGTRVNATGTYWYANWTNRTFTVYGYFNATNNTLSPASIYSYQYSTVSCAVKDQFSGYPVNGATVNFYRNGTLLGSNTTNAAGNTDLTFSVNATGTYTITCNLTDQLGIYYYRGDAPEYNATLTVLPFPIDVVSPANGTVVDRDSYDASDPDLITLNVTVPSYVPDGVSIDFVANLTTPSGIASTTNVLLGTNTTSSSYAVLHYNPSAATYAGNWTWGGNNSEGKMNTTAIYTSKGALVTVYRNNTFDPNASYNQTDTAIIEVNVTSQGPETRDELNASYTVSVRNTIANTSGSNNNATLTYTNPHWSGSHTLSALYGVGVWSTNATANGSFWYANSTNRTFLLYGFMNITSNTTSPGTIYAYESVTGSCTVRDQLSQYFVNGATVNFYRDGVLVGSNTTNALGVTDFTFQTNTSGTHTMTCNVTDQPGIYYYRGNAPEGNATYTVLPFPITPVASANGTVVDRDSYDPTDNDTILLNVTVPTYIPDGVQIDFIANLTTPNIGGQTGITLGSNTTTNGYAILHYNPSSTTYAGNYTWWGNNTSATQNGTMNFIEKGSLATTYADSSLHPNSTYYSNSTITTNTNITSAGPETTDQLNSSYTITANNTVTNTSGVTTSVALTYNGSQWINTTVSVLSLRGVGLWGTNISSTGTYWYTNYTNRSFLVYGYFNISSNITSPASSYAYQNTTTTCTVQDQFSQYAVSSANVSFYRSGTYLGSNTTNAAGSTELTFNVNSTGTYTITCNLTDQPTIYYYRGDAPEGNSTLVVTPFPITPVAPVNDTIVDRDETNSTVNDTIIINATVPSVIPAGVQIDFIANLTAPSGIAGTTNILLGSNTTTIDNYVFIYYNPSNTTYAGNYTWAGNQSGGYANGTNSFLSYGSANITYESATVDPNTSYLKPANVTIAATIVSYGIENVSTLDARYSPTVNSTLYLPNGTLQAALTLLFNGSRWNNTYSMPITDPRGRWETYLDGQLSYFYLINASNRTFLVNNTPPTHTTPVLNATDNPFNTTRANLTAYNQSTLDYDTDPVTNIYTWSMNGSPISLFILPFDTNVSVLTQYAVRDYANSNNATLGNYSASRIPTWTPSGVSGGAYSFDGVDDIMSLGDIAPPTSVTITAWVYPSGTMPQGGAIVSKLDEYVLYVKSNGALAFNINGTQVADDPFNYTSVANRQQWYHLAGVFDNTNDVLRIYRNGILTNTSAYTGDLPNNSTNISIGYLLQGGTSPFNGTLDEIHLYNRSLSADQIYQLWFEGNRSLKNSTIVANETQRDEVWQACVTPNDNADDGTTLCSNTVTITGVVDPYAPSNDSRVDRDSADATDPDSLNLTATTYGDSGVNVSFYANLTAPNSIAGQTGILLGTALSNSTGYAVLSYNPNSTMYAGNYSWYTSAANSTTTSSLRFTIYGSFALNHTTAASNPGQNQTRNETVEIRFNISSNGPENYSDFNDSYSAGVTSNITNASGSIDSRSTSHTGPYWNTSHAMSTLGGVGTWNSSGNASAWYFYNNTTYRTFTLFSYANVTNVSVSPSPIYAYGTTQASCAVIDAFNAAPLPNQVVFFYRNGTLVGTNATNNAGQTSFAFQTNTSGNYSMNCTIADNLSAYYLAGLFTTNASLEVLKYPLTPLSPANDTAVDRDGVSTDPDVVTLNITVPTGVPDGVTITFRANLTAPSGIVGQTDLYLGNNTTSGNAAIIYFDPGSTTYAGNYTWFGEETEGLANGSLRYGVFGSYNQSYLSDTLHPNSTYFQNDTITTEANATSNGIESRDQLNASYSAALTNTVANSSGSATAANLVYNGSNWRNTTISILTIGGVGVWNTTLASSAQYFYAPNNTNRTFAVYGYFNITTNTTAPASMYAYETAATACRVQDQHTANEVQNANVTYYRNGTYLGSNVTNSAGQTTLYYSVNTTGTYTITCNLTNQPSIYYYRGDAPEGNSTLTVIPFAVEAVSPANDTAVDRDGTNASTADIISLNATVPSFVPAGENILFYANLTDPILGATSVPIGINTTTVGNWAVFHFDPNASTQAGNWTWYANHSAGFANSSRTYSVWGSVNVSFVSSSLNPNSNYTKPTNVTIDANFTSFGSDTSSTINASYAAAMNVSLQYPNGTQGYGLNVTYNSTSWNVKQEFLLPEPRGDWTAVLSGVLRWFYVNTSQSRVFHINNVAPTHTTPVLNASDNPYNTTDANLTAYNQSTFDYEGDAVTNIYTWSLNGSSIVLGHYAFDTNVTTNTSGAVRDYAGSDNNATLGGGTSANVPYWNSTGKVGGAYTFDGSNDYIDAGDINAIDGASQLSIAAWIKVEDLTKDNDIVTKGTHGATTPILFWRDEVGSVSGRTDVISILIYSGAASQRIEGATNSLNNNAWHHVAFTYIGNSATGLRLYIDGVEDANSPVSTATVATLGSNANSVFIGADTGLANVFKGGIDDVRIYNRTLSAAQIAQIYSEGNNNLTTASIVANETQRNDVWQACVTPNDNADDGTTLCSNTVTIYGLVDAYSPANDTVIDRDSFSATDPDSINLTANTHGDSGVNVTFRANVTDPAVSGQTDLILGYAVSNSTGYAVLSFNPNSSMYAGNYTWWPEASNTSTLSVRTFSVYGGANVTYSASNSNPAANHTENESVDIRVNVTSGGPENESVLNGTYSAFIQSTLRNPAGTNDTKNATLVVTYWNATHRLLDLSGVGIWNSTVNTTLNWFYQPANATALFDVFGYANVTNFTVSPNPVDAYNIVTYICAVQNEYTQVAVANYNVSFSFNGTVIGTNLTNTSGHAAYYYQPTVDGLFNVTCSIGNETSLYYFAGDEWNQTTVLNVTPIFLTPVSPANGTAVDRDSVDSTISDLAVLTGSTLAGVPDGINVTFYANLTDPSIAGQSNIILGYNVTNSTTITFVFNPNSSLYAGSYDWWMDASGSVPNGSMTVAVYGGANISYSDELLNPNVNYSENDTAVFEVNITSLGPENHSDLNSSYNATVNLTLYTAGGENLTKNATYTGTLWNTSQYLLTYGMGVWNTSASIVANYFLSVQHDLRNFTVYGFINASVFDTEEYNNTPLWANSPGYYFANVTNSTDEPLVDATCTLSFFDRNVTMTYNGTTTLYEAQTEFSLEGIVLYNLTCEKPFYYTATDAQNATIHSRVNLSMQWNRTEVAGDSLVTVNITNEQNYTENDIYLWIFIPDDQNVVSYFVSTPVNTTPITGQYSGNSTMYYFPNISAGSSQGASIRLRNNTADWYYSDLFVGGFSSSSVNNTIY